MNDDERFKQLEQRLADVMQRIATLEQEKVQQRAAVAKAWGLVIVLAETTEDRVKAVEKEQRDQGDTLRQLTGRPRQKKERDTGSLVDQQRRRWAIKIAELIDRHFSRDDLEELCFGLGVDYENLASNGKRTKARALVLRYFRHGTLDLLVQECQYRRPLAQWPLQPIDVDIQIDIEEGL